MTLEYFVFLCVCVLALSLTSPPHPVVYPSSPCKMMKCTIQISFLATCRIQITIRASSTRNRHLNLWEHVWKRLPKCCSLFSRSSFFSSYIFYPLEIERDFKLQAVRKVLNSPPVLVSSRFPWTNHTPPSSSTPSQHFPAPSATFHLLFLRNGRRRKPSVKRW